MRSPSFPFSSLRLSVPNFQADELDEQQGYEQQQLGAAWNSEDEMDPIPELDFPITEVEVDLETPTTPSATQRKNSGDASILGSSRPRSETSDGSDDSRHSRHSWIEGMDETARPIPWGASSPRSSIHMPQHSLDRRRSSSSGPGSSSSINGSISGSTTPSPTHDNLMIPTTPKSASASDFRSKGLFTLTPPPPSPLPLPPLTPASVISRTTIQSDDRDDWRPGAGTLAGSASAGRSRVSLDVVSGNNGLDPALPPRESMDRPPNEHSNPLVLSHSLTSKSPIGAVGVPMMLIPPTPSMDQEPEGASLLSNRLQLNNGDSFVDDDDDDGAHEEDHDDDDDITIETHERAEISGYTEPKRVPVDLTLRSTPGVIGLGEGWAGGPQPKPKKRWFKRGSKSHQISAADDPLALWTIDENNAVSSGSGGNRPGISTIPSSNPFKSMWVKSTRSFFGSSTITLSNGEKNNPDSSIGSERKRLSAVSRAKNLFSKSKLNLSSLDKNEHRNPQQTPKSNQPKRNSLVVFSRRSSRHPLTEGSGPNSTKSISLRSAPNLLQTFSNSRSQASFFPETRTPRSSTVLSRESFARSESDLLLSIPKRLSSLETRNGADSLFAGGGGHWFARMDVPDPVMEDDEEATFVDSAGFPVNHATQQHRIPLRRSSTFGQEDLSRSTTPRRENHPFLVQSTLQQHFATPTSQSTTTPTPRVDADPDHLPDPSPPRNINQSSASAFTAPFNEDRRSSFMGKLKTKLSRRQSISNTRDNNTGLSRHPRPASGMTFTSFSRPSSRIFFRRDDENTIMGDATPRKEVIRSLASRNTSSTPPRPLVSSTDKSHVTTVTELVRSLPVSATDESASRKDGERVIIDAPATPTVTDSEYQEEKIVTPVQGITLGPHMPATSSNSYDVSKRVVENMLSLSSCPSNASIIPASSNNNRQSVPCLAALSSDNVPKRLSKFDEEPVIRGTNGEKRMSLRSRIGSMNRNNKKANRRASVVGTVFPRPPSASDVQNAAMNTRPQWSYSASASMSALDRLGSLDFGSEGLGIDDLFGIRRESSSQGVERREPEVVKDLGADRDASILYSKAATAYGVNVKPEHSHGQAESVSETIKMMSRHTRNHSIPVNVDNLASSSSESLTQEALGIIAFPLPPSLVKFDSVNDEEMEHLVSTEHDTRDMFTSPGQQQQQRIIHVDLFSSLNKFSSPRAVELPPLTEEETEVPRASMDSMISTESDSLSAEGEVEQAVLMVPRKASYVGVESLGTPIIDLSPMSHMVATMADTSDEQY